MPKLAQIVTQDVEYPEHWFQPHDLMVFVQSSKFSQRWDELGLRDNDLQALEVAIMAQPDGAPVIKGTGGLRKLRFTSSRLKTGKRGGLRICYVVFEEYSVVHLLVVYEKVEQDDLSPAAKRGIAIKIQEIKSELAAGKSLEE